MLYKFSLPDQLSNTYDCYLEIEGVLTPGAPALPECVKADVYLPPVIMNEHPEAHTTIAQIVQNFIESVGVPMIHCWTHAGKKCGWTLSQSGHVYTQLTPSLHPLVPSPIPGTSHYLFYGRPHGSLSTGNYNPSTSHTSDSDATSVDSHAQPTMSQDSDMYGPPLSETTLELANYIEEIAGLKEVFTLPPVFL
jgi:hypothetical protein